LFPKIDNQIILVAALDWGLGHATRCFPIVENFLIQNKKIILAGSGISGQLLKNTFPNLRYYELPGYNINYSNKLFFSLKMASQVPKIVRAIKQENRSLTQIIEKENIETIISDNRYGIYKKGLQNIIVCHQLNLKSPFLKSILNKIYQNYFKPFDECWVPDFENNLESLAGELSHKSNFKIPVKYLGAISRFKNIAEVKTNDKILILLSGPEPQRSILEKMLFDEVKKIPHYKFVLLRGTTKKNTSQLNWSKNIEVKDFLTETNLEQLILESRIVICRAGYTSLMDLYLLNKKAILIPTPGQWEQEYLAQWNNKKSNFLFVDQSQINLEKNIAHFNTE
jgi:uncharacterized protein (TIGR00661 family)